MTDTSRETELFMDIMKHTKPLLESAYKELTFQFEKDDDDWDVVVSYIDAANGARRTLPDIPALEEPVSELVGLCDADGRGLLRRGAFVVNEKGQVEMKIEYDK